MINLKENQIKKLIKQVNKKNIIKNNFIYDNVIFYNLYFINGNVFYAFEYLYYLKDKFKLIINVPNRSFLTEIILKWFDKYEINYIYEIIDKIYFNLNKKIISKNILFLDGTSINKLNNTIFGKNIIYNYGDNQKSLNKKFNNKSIITIGDKEIGSIVDYHFPLCLNYKLFKKIKYFENRYFIEDKRDSSIYDIYKRVRNIKNFHQSFNHLIFYKHNFWERANRLILECKYYKKSVDVYNTDRFIDSVSIRSKKPWQAYDLNDSNFKEFVYEIFKIKS